MAFIANTSSTAIAKLSGRTLVAGNATPSTISIGIKDISTGGGGGGPIIPTEGIIWWPKRSS